MFFSGRATERMLPAIFSFDVHKGECLAVQIMDARGMEELRKILTGDILPESGELLLNGKQTEIPGNGRIAVIQERTTKTMIFSRNWII